MQPGVQLSLPALDGIGEGRTVTVGPGAIVGRLRGAAVHLPDPRISEAHALVSLRGEGLRLLALGGGLALGDRPTTRITLVEGQVIQLATGVEIGVIAVTIPGEVLSVSLGASSPEPLRRAVYRVMAGPPLALLPGYRPDALAVLWSDEAGWWWTIPGHAPEPIVPGATRVVAGVPLRFLALPRAVLDTPSTVARGRIGPLLLLRLRYSTVHIDVEGRPSLVLDGLPARVIGELHSFGGPTPWQLVAAEVWPDEPDPAVLRGLWDQCLRRLRRRLEEGGLRRDLVRPHARGDVELYLLPGDQVVDEG